MSKKMAIDERPICGVKYKPHPIEKKHQADSRIKLEFAVRGTDTTYLTELICLDSIKLTDVIREFDVNPMCLEMIIQGRTYFSAKTNKYGGFENVKVIIGVDPCFKDLEEKIISKVSKMRILQEEHFSSDIYFSYLYMIF